MYTIEYKTLQLASKFSWFCISLFPIALSAVLFLALPMLFSGCNLEEKKEVREPVPRPVNYVVLKRSDHSHLTRVTGSVESWKKEMISFKVSGRLVEVVEPGVEIQGHSFDDSGNKISQGTMIARLDSSQFRLRLQEAEARMKTEEAKANAVKIEINKYFPELMKEAKADFDRDKKEFQRQSKALPSGATSKKRHDEAEAAYRTASARIAQIQADKAKKTAELAAVDAQILEAKQLVEQAKIDLQDTELYSYFHSQIAKVHVIQGGYVEKGQPVVTVQMMDPMKVEIAVSPQRDKKINYGDFLKVYQEDWDTPVDGAVYLRDTVADAATRTFMITLLLRNYMVEPDIPEKLKDKKYHRVSELENLVSEKGDGRPPFYINQDFLNSDSSGHYLWKAEGVSSQELSGNLAPVFKIKKVRVVPGSGKFRLLQLWTFVELKNYGNLNPHKYLAAGKLPETAKEGDTVVYSRKKWLLRPGELVHVDLKQGNVEPGFYVPTRSIMNDKTSQYIFVVDEKEKGQEQARKVKIRVGSSLSDFLRIEPLEKDQLAEGMKVVIDGAHYLHDGELISGYNEIEVSP